MAAVIASRAQLATAPHLQQLLQRLQLLLLGPLLLLLLLLQACSVSALWLHPSIRLRLVPRLLLLPGYLYEACDGVPAAGCLYCCWFRQAVVPHSGWACCCR
jgi:hypothetical protein